MRAIRYHEHGDPDVLSVEDVPIPDPAADEILVDVKAAAVSPIDAHLRRGVTHEPDSLPVIPGAEFAGVVTEVGSEVTEFQEGDRVFGSTGKHIQSTYAEYAAVPEKYAAPLPDNVGFREGAGVGNSGGVALYTLIDRGGATLGDTCLIHGGSGGVGHIGVQLALAAGAKVVTTAGSKAGREKLSEFGATAAFDYRRDDLATAINDGAPDGVDIVLEYLPDTYIDLDVEVAANDCSIYVIDKEEMHMSTVHPARGNNVSVHFTSLGLETDKRTILRRLSGHLADGVFSTVVHETYDLEDAAQAHADLVNESYLGTLVLEP